MQPMRTNFVVMRACQKVMPASVLLMRSSTVVRGSASRKLSTADDNAIRDVGTVKISSFDAFGLNAGAHFNFLDNTTRRGNQAQRRRMQQSPIVSFQKREPRGCPAS